MNYHMYYHMKMSPKVVRKIQRTNKGQWTITVPSVVAEMMEIEVGDSFEISIIGDTSDATLKMKKVKE